MMIDELKLLKEIGYSSGEGELRVGGVRVFLSSTDILNVTREKIIGIGPAGRRFMYEAGKAAGRRYAEAVEEIYGRVEAKNRFVESCERFGSLTGWGHLKVVEEDFNSFFFKITLRNTFFSSDKQEKTCEYNAGMLAGAAEVILGREMDVLETQCVNESDEFDECVFSMKPSVEFKQLF